MALNLQSRPFVQAGSEPIAAAAGRVERLPLRIALSASVLILSAACAEQPQPPGYDVLFAGDRVHRVDISISAADHAALMTNLEEVLCCGGSLPDSHPDPMWVTVTVNHDGNTWRNVAMRYKGNSSLWFPYHNGARKLPFRLNFTRAGGADKFYGFDKMTFSNGFHDPALVRDRLAAEIFRSAGVPVAETAHARVFIDSGEGPIYAGLYTMIEDPSDRMMKAQFGRGSGNLYKPEGDGATWSTFAESDFEKKSNLAEADFSDVENAMAALHADRSDAATWRAELEQRFDAYGFLDWLAINQVIVNWDSYGLMPHNYYLYGDPDDSGRLHWIPWDLNESLKHDQYNPTLSLSLGEVGSRWPLIRFLLDDPVYRDYYRESVDAALDGPFAPDNVEALIDRYYDQIAVYVTGAEGEEWPYRTSRPEEFQAAHSASGDDSLRAFVDRRRAEVRAELADM